MTAINTATDRKNERGNVLFLILIAVALFAALSYAVTQSTRSGSGDASGETNLINSAQLAQYPAGVRTAVVRMIIGGVSVEQLGFDNPALFSTVSDLSYNVFHPTGGGAVFQSAPQDVLAPTGAGDWIFSSKFQIEGVGATTPADNSGNDIIAFLPGVAQNVCRKLNDELGIEPSVATADRIPQLVGPSGPSTAPVLADSMAEDIAGASLGIPAGAPTAIISGDFNGQPFGCFRIGAAGPTANYIYYHVLVER